MKKSLIVPVIILSTAFLTSCGDNSSSGEFEYVALGASDATGIGASPLDEGYVFEIQEELEKDGRDVGLLNLGIPGAETDEIQNLELDVAVAEEPELVTVFTGANDITAGNSREDFINDLSDILGKLANETDALVVIGTIPDLTQLPRYIDEPDSDVTKERIDDFNNIIRNLAAQNGALVVELAAITPSALIVADDGFHPNDEGHQLIAEEFLKVIRPNLPPVEENS